MAGRRPFQNRGRQKSAPRQFEPPPATPRPVKQPPRVYGAPFVLMEDDRKSTFAFVGGAWVPYERTIAECRVDCQVTALAQKVNNMTRYEIRPQL